jgi:hypothetical protein
MKKLTLSLMLGLGLVSQIHDLTAEDSKPLDYNYLVLNETLIEDLPAFKALHSEWQSWICDTNPNPNIRDKVSFFILRVLYIDIR